LAAITLALLVGVLVAAATWWVLPNFLPPPKHTVQTLLHVLPTPVPILFPNVDPPGEFLSSQQTQMELVRSRLVLNVALREPEVANLPIIHEQFDAAEWLEKQVRADFSLSPEIMKISMVGDNPDELTVILKGVTKAYMEEIVDKELNRRRQRLQTLKDLHSRYEQKLKEKRAELRNLTVLEAGGNDPEAFAVFQKFAQEQVGELKKQLFQNQTKLRGLRTELLLQKARERAMQAAIFPIGAADLTVQSLGAQALLPLGVPLGSLMHRAAALAMMEVDPSTPPPLADLEELLAKDRPTVKLKERLDQLETDLTDALVTTVKGENDPNVQQLRDQVKKTQAAIAERRARLLPILAAQARSKAHAEVQHAVRKLRQEIGWYEELGEALKRDLQTREAQIQRKAGDRFDLMMVKNEIEQQEKIARKAADEAAALEVEIDAPSRTKLLQDPVTLFAQPSQQRLLFSLLAGLVTLVLVFLVIVVRVRVAPSLRP
jgi:hypothetical protein